MTRATVGGGIRAQRGRGVMSISRQTSASSRATRRGGVGGILLLGSRAAVLPRTCCAPTSPPPSPKPARRRRRCGCRRAAGPSRRSLHCNAGRRRRRATCPRGGSRASGPTAALLRCCAVRCAATRPVGCRRTMRSEHVVVGTSPRSVPLLAGRRIGRLQSLSAVQSGSNTSLVRVRRSCLGRSTRHGRSARSQGRSARRRGAARRYALHSRYPGGCGSGAAGPPRHTPQC